MNYGLTHKVVTFNVDAMSVVNQCTKNPTLEWKDATLFDKTKNKRKSSVTWLQDPLFYTMLMKMVAQINKTAGWNFKITGVEPVQYGLYPEGGYYGWHVDQHPKPVKGMVRKISMSLFLNEEYEGGTFDLEIYKPGTDPRYESFRLNRGQAIFFPADTWHRVQPVTKGLRESIVAWFYGPPYQ